MPITNCVRFNNRIYCYDEQKKAIVCYEERTVNPSECPDSVVLALLGKKDNGIIDINGKDS